MAQKSGNLQPQDGPIVAMFCASGHLVRDWAEAGFTCYCYDLLNTRRIEHVGKGTIEYRNGDLSDKKVLNEIIALRPAAVFGAPPCTDMAVSGAKHFTAKAKKNPNFQIEACKLARTVEYVGEKAGCIWFAENPVSVLATLWRKPNWRFHPWQFGGYLPLDDIHPNWPQYIVARDAYPKKSCLWSGGGYTLPLIYPVKVEPGYSKQFKKLGGKSEKTKRIRNEGPRGFSRANFLHLTGGMPAHLPTTHYEKFTAAIKTATILNPHGASVHVYTPDEYKQMRLFLAPDTASGFALKGAELVSVFSCVRTRFPSIMNAALANGAGTLDIFDGPLVAMYKAYGFIEVDRVSWNEDYRPVLWQDSMGTPDVVYMKRKG